MSKGDARGTEERRGRGGARTLGIALCAAGVFVARKFRRN